MTVTKKMVLEINGFFRAVGEAELTVSNLDEAGSELEHLRRVKQAYTTRLLKKMPKLRTLPVQMIPDLFLQALSNREAELVAKGDGR